VFLNTGFYCAENEFCLKNPEHNVNEIKEEDQGPIRKCFKKCIPGCSKSQYCDH
jgi:hypothetical protein